MPAPVSNRFVTPKSDRNARSDDERASDASRMFPGFTSRWTSPAAWAASSAAAACEIRDDGAVRLQSRFAAQQPLEIGALHVPHRDVQDAVGLARVVDRDDVRVVEAGGDLGLADEALPERVIIGELGTEDLQRDLAAQPDVLGQVDDRHPTAADHPHHAMPRELGSRPADRSYAVHGRRGGIGERRLPRGRHPLPGVARVGRASSGARRTSCPAPRRVRSARCRLPGCLSSRPPSLR